jgi:predicted RNA-binding Zn-ribbon protein involved in translation (DUF1610 family)
VDAKRCLSCGEVRWSFLPLGDTEVKCPACGETMVPERRRPGREPRFSRAERRDAAEFPSALKLR